MKTVEAFKKYVESIETKSTYQRPKAFGIGIRRRRDDKTLDVFYPHINFEQAFGTAAILQDVIENDSGQNGFEVLSKMQLSIILSKFEAFRDDVKSHPNIELLHNLLSYYNETDTYHKTDIIAYFMFDGSTEVQSAEEAYFKLQCLSQLLCKPHELNTSSIFGKLNNVAWTNKGPILPEDLAEQRIKWTFRGEEMVVSHVDKFPYMVNFHVPNGVRVVSGAKVRLGAHLSKGTTVMPAGYVNFNAGTLGSAMVEGRISAGVVVGSNSDLGGGASIMGTLSGGNKNVISIGEKCLLGANAGTGISLGDGCTVGAGVYLTAASKVSLYNHEMLPVDIDGNVVSEGQNIVKAHQLNGKPYMLYYQDSLTGKLIARPNSKTIELNQSLHE